MYTQCHFLQWLSLSIPTEEVRPFTLRYVYLHEVSFSAMAHDQFVDTNRGGKTLHFEGYIYMKIRDGANGFQFWRCQNHKAGCLARATSEGSLTLDEYLAAIKHLTGL